MECRHARVFDRHAEPSAGHEAGSWFFEGTDLGSTAGGRLYCTAMATMILEVYYRHFAPLQRAEHERRDSSSRAARGDKTPRPAEWNPKKGQRYVSDAAQPLPSLGLTFVGSAAGGRIFGGESLVAVEAVGNAIRSRPAAPGTKPWRDSAGSRSARFETRFGRSRPAAASARAGSAADPPARHLPAEPCFRW